MLETIKDRNQRVIGTIETDSQGNKTAKDEGGRVLGIIKKTEHLKQSFKAYTYFFEEMPSV